MQSFLNLSIIGIIISVIVLVGNANFGFADRAKR